VPPLDGTPEAELAGAVSESSPAGGVAGGWTGLG